MRSDVADITDLAGCRAAVDVQLEVWGPDSETVPSSLLLASVRRGGVLAGVRDDARLVAFVWSMPGWRNGRPTHWSHMLAVRPEARGRGLGLLLKRAQRDRVLAQPGVDLVEWTFDPLQAVNAHLNIARLGCVAGTYHQNAYGEMQGPLHRGTPTDRLVAEWWIRRPEVVARLAGGDEASGAPAGAPGPASSTSADAPLVIAPRDAGAWRAAGPVDTTLTAARVRVPVPPRFGEMQREATSLALAWRLAAREAFTAYFARGYRVVDFAIDRARGGGEYVLARR